MATKSKKEDSDGSEGKPSRRPYRYELLAGKWFVILGKLLHTDDAELGVILFCCETGWFLCEFVKQGKNIQRIVAIEDMKDWMFYNDAKDAFAAAKAY